MGVLGTELSREPVLGLNQLNAPTISQVVNPLPKDFHKENLQI